MSFASEPGRDDGSLPPVNVVIPDDARELARDVLAYRREVRAQRRRQRFLRVLRPFRAPEFGGQTALIPLIAICLAVTLVGGALLSVATMGPAAAPTLSQSQTPAPTAAPAAAPSPLPAGSVRLDGSAVPVRTLVTSAIALVPTGCACGPQLQRLAQQTAAANVRLYFSAAGPTIAELAVLTTRYGDGRAVAAADYDSVLNATYRPVGFTVLLVFRDATAEVVRDLSFDFLLTPTLRKLGQPGASLATSPPTAV